jgi:hypothetical protein
VITGPPDFVGVGAQGAGVRWWERLLADHPRVHPGGIRHFFEAFCARPLTDADVAEYHASFPRPEGELAGEWSPRYAYDFWTPRLLARAAPDAKLLMLVRDPVERFRTGLAVQARHFAQRKEQTAADDAIERGRYGAQLRRLHAHAGPDRVLVLQYERCVRDPAGEYARTLEFLGLGPHTPADLGAPAEPEGPEVWPDLRAAIRDALAADAAELARLAPGVDLALWPDFAP